MYLLRSADDPPWMDSCAVFTMRRMRLEGFNTVSVLSTEKWPHGGESPYSDSVRAPWPVSRSKSAEKKGRKKERKGKRGPVEGDSKSDWD